MVTYTTTNTFATGGIVSGNTITWSTTAPLTYAPCSTYTNFNYRFFVKKDRGWNGKTQARCGGCGRWAKKVKPKVVVCTRCLGEMEIW